MLQQEKQHAHEKEMQQQKLQQEKNQQQDVNVVHLQEKLRGEEQQEKLLAEEQQREDDADLFLFFLIKIWYELLRFLQQTNSHYNMNQYGFFTHKKGVLPFYRE